MGAGSSKKYLVLRENTSRVLTRDQIPTYQKYRAKKAKSRSTIVQTQGGNQITVDVSPKINLYYRVDINPSVPDSLICVRSRLRQIGAFRSLKSDCMKLRHLTMS